jgi:hypothetical protein
MHIGDKVRFLNENLSGTITSFGKDGLLGVTIEDGFELDVLASEIVVTEPLVKQAAGQEPVRRDAPKPPPELQGGLFLLVGKNDKQHWMMRLLNRSGSIVLFTLYRRTPAATELMAHGELKDGLEIPCGELGMSAPDKWGDWYLQALPVRQFPGQVPELQIFTRRFRQGEFQSTPYRMGGLPLFAFRLDTEAPETESSPEAPKTAPEPGPYRAVNFDKPAEEIDLHAEALGIDPTLSGDVILRKQMEEFQRRLELAIAYRMPSLTVIHGVGSGVLRNLIEIALRGNPGVRDWQPADARTYGQGALRIKLRS